MSNKKKSIFSEEAIHNFVGFYQALKEIHTRLKREWYMIKNDVDLVKKTKIKTFELLSRDSRNVEIITFGELFEGERFIVENREFYQDKN